MVNPGEPGGVDTEIANMRGIWAVYAAGIPNPSTLEAGGTSGLIAITTTDIPDDAAALRIAAEIAGLNRIVSVGKVSRVIRVEPRVNWHRQRTVEG